MLRLIQCTVLLLVLHSVMSATSNPVIIPKNDNIETCPLQEKRDLAIQGIGASVQAAIMEDFGNSLSCESGLWHRVAHLNMSDPAQRCPSAWTENSTNGVRTCGRPLSSSGSCLSAFYPTGRQYSRVCGRAIGYQYGSTEAFSHQAVATIDSYYVYGVSVTHGLPRNHIWTFAAGVSEGGYTPVVKDGTALAAILVILIMFSHLHLLGITTTVSRAIQEIGTLLIISTPMTHSGMVSSVKASVAAMGSLLHGSVWSYPTQRLTISRSAYVSLKKVMMILKSSCLNYTFNKRNYMYDFSFY